VPKRSIISCMTSEHSRRGLGCATIIRRVATVVRAEGVILARRALSEIATKGVQRIMLLAFGRQLSASFDFLTLAGFSTSSKIEDRECLRAFRRPSRPV
jgi:hypothetical protein